MSLGVFVLLQSVAVLDIHMDKKADANIKPHNF
jgi:hypothetical protein